MDLLQHKLLAPSLILIMFFMSGIHKVISLQKTIGNVQTRLNVNEFLAKLSVYIVIAIEIIAPIIIIYYIVTNNYGKYANYAVWALIAFTIIVTAVYHPPNLNYYKSVAFWANISLIGGLLLLEKDTRK